MTQNMKFDKSLASPHGRLSSVQSMQLEGMEAISGNPVDAVMISGELQQRLVDDHSRGAGGPVAEMRATHKSWREARQATVGALSLHSDVPFIAAAEALNTRESGPAYPGRDDVYDDYVISLANQYQGDTRKLILDACAAAAPIIPRTFGQFSSQGQRAIEKAFENATHMQAEAAKELIYALFGSRWLADQPSEIRKNPYASGGHGLTRQQQRLLAALNLTSDVGASFSGAIRGGIELSAINIADLRFSLAERGHSPENLDAATIANIGKISCWALGHFWQARTALAKRQLTGPERSFMEQGHEVELQDPYLRRLYRRGIPRHCVGAFPVIKRDEQTQLAVDSLIAGIATMARGRLPDVNGSSVVRSSLAVGALTVAVALRH
jgi:hypothetical protein